MFLFSSLFSHARNHSPTAIIRWIHLKAPCGKSMLKRRIFSPKTTCTIQRKRKSTKKCKKKKIVAQTYPSVIYFLSSPMPDLGKHYRTGFMFLKLNLPELIQKASNRVTRPTDSRFVLRPIRVLLGNNSQLYK